MALLSLSLSLSLSCKTPNSAAMTTSRWGRMRDKYPHMRLAFPCFTVYLVRERDTWQSWQVVGTVQKSMPFKTSQDVWKRSVIYLNHYTYSAVRLTLICALPFSHNDGVFAHDCTTFDRIIIFCISRSVGRHCLHCCRQSTMKCICSPRQN